MTKNIQPPTYSSENPYPWYRWIQETCPIFKKTDGTWMITRYDDVMMLLNDVRCSHWGHDSDFFFNMHPVEKSIAQTLHALAPGNTPAFRKQIMHQLAAKTLRVDEGEIRKQADMILERLSSSSSIEFMNDYAHPFTFGTISRLIGIQEDEIEELSKIISDMKGGYLSFIDKTLRDHTENGHGRLFIAAIKRLIILKQKKPGDDLCSALLAVCSGDELHEPFIISLIILLFYAGHQNMMNFMGNALVSLNNKMKEQSMLRESLSIAIDSVDELIRYDSPLQSVLLITKEAITIRDHLIPARSILELSIGAANRDPLKFDHADQLILERRPSHLGFGVGAFRCIGARLAQLEGGIGLHRFFAHIHSFSLTPENISWSHFGVQRGPSSILLDINWNHE